MSPIFEGAKVVKIADFVYINFWFFVKKRTAFKCDVY
jgi:hypothetical protein